MLEKLLRLRTLVAILLLSIAAAQAHYHLTADICLDPESGEFVGRMMKCDELHYTCKKDLRSKIFYLMYF